MGDGKTRETNNDGTLLDALLSVAVPPDPSLLSDPWLEDLHLVKWTLSILPPKSSSSELQRRQSLPLHCQGQIHPYPAASCSIFLPTSPFALVRLIQFQMQSNSFWREVRYLYTKVEVSRQNNQMACLF